MLTACLGWGSLIWDPRELPVQEKWFNDGPFLPIEFARQSKNGRLTLVLVPENKVLVRSLWTLFTVSTVESARDALCERENIPEKNQGKHIHFWPDDSPRNSITMEIERWAHSLRLTAVVWTGLLPKIIKEGKEENRAPTPEEAITHLHNLSHEQRRNAERYVRMTPRQVDTPYRRLFEAEFGWTPLSEI